MEYVALGQSIGALEIQRSENLSRDHCIRNVGWVLGNFLDHAVTKQIAVFIPRAATKFVGNILHEASHDVPSGSGERWISIRGNDAIDPKLFGDFPELGDVVTTLGEFERRN